MAESDEDVKFGFTEEKGTPGKNVLQRKDVDKKGNPGSRVGTRVPGLRGPATEAGPEGGEDDLHPAPGRCTRR